MLNCEGSEILPYLQGKEFPKRLQKTYYSWLRGQAITDIRTAAEVARAAAFAPLHWASVFRVTHRGLGDIWVLTRRHRSRRTLNLGNMNLLKWVVSTCALCFGGRCCVSSVYRRPWKDGLEHRQLVLPPERWAEMCERRQKPQMGFCKIDLNKWLTDFTWQKMV